MIFLSQFTENENKLLFNEFNSDILTQIRSVILTFRNFQRHYWRKTVYGAKTNSETITIPRIHRQRIFIGIWGEIFKGFGGSNVNERVATNSLKIVKLIFEDTCFK